MGFVINEHKTKLMLSSASANLIKRIGQNIILRDYNFEVVKEFVYLITGTDNLGAEIRRHIVAANRCYQGLTRQLQSRALSRRVKCNIYKTLNKPVLTYGSECWILSKVDEEVLLRFERKILRKIYGPICERREWRRRYKQELYEIYNEVKVR